MLRMSRAQALTTLAVVVGWMLTYSFFHPLDSDGTIIVIKLPF